MQREALVNEQSTAEPQAQERTWVLRLFVTGASPNSMRAINNLTRICEQYIKGCYELEVIDVYQQQLSAMSEQIIALPMLIKESPYPKRRLIGDMSDTEKVLKGLGLNNDQ